MKKLTAALAAIALAFFDPVYRALTLFMARQGLILFNYNFPEGAKFLFSNTFAAAKTLATMSNANPCAASSVSHGYIDDDEVLLTSGWEDATDTIYKVDQTGVDAFNILALDTTSTTRFTPGGGAGSTTLKLSNWLEVPQVLTIATTGGDPVFTPVKPLARRNAFNVPTGLNPVNISLTLGHDASNSNYQTMLGISRVTGKVGFKMVLADGSLSYGYGYMSVGEVPSLNNNQPNSVVAVFSLLNRAVGYAS